MKYCVKKKLYKNGHSIIGVFVYKQKCSVTSKMIGISGGETPPLRTILPHHLSVDRTVGIEGIKREESTGWI